MPDYQKMYFNLFNAVTHAMDTLQKAQQKCEETYVSGDDAPLIILPKTADKKQGSHNRRLFWSY